MPFCHHAKWLLVSFLCCDFCDLSAKKSDSREMLDEFIIKGQSKRNASNSESF